MPSHMTLGDILDESFLDNAKEDILERLEFLTYIGVLNEPPSGQAWKIDDNLLPYFDTMPEQEEVDNMSEEQLELYRAIMRPDEPATTANEPDEPIFAPIFAPFSFEFTFVDAIFHCIPDDVGTLDLIAGPELRLLKDHFNDLTATCERPPLDQICQRVLDIIKICMREIVKRYDNREENLDAAYQFLNALLPGSCMHVLLLGCSHASWGEETLMAQIRDLRSKYYRLMYFFEIDHWFRPLEFDADYNLILPQ